MPKASFQQANFLGGEWSPTFQGRVDNPRYKTAMNLSCNGYPVEEGAWVKRSGFKDIGPTPGGVPARLFPFSVNEDTPFEVELSQNRLRVWAGDKLCLDSVATLLSISQTNPSQIVVSAAGAAWATGDEVVLIPTSGPAYAFGSLPALTMVLTEVSTQVFTLTDAYTGATIDGAQLANILGAATANIGHVYLAATPYNNSDWYDMKPTMVGTTMFMFHPAYPPQTLALTNNVPASPIQNTLFTFSAPLFDNGPYMDEVADQTLTISATSGAVAVVFTNGFGPNQTAPTAADVGRIIRIFNEPPQWNNSTHYAAGVAVSTGVIAGEGNSYFYSTAANNGLSPSTNPQAWAEDPELAAWIWATITAYDSPTEVTAALEIDALYDGGSYSWQLGVFGDPIYGYPACGCFHEGRLWLFGATRIDGGYAASPFTVMDPTLIDGTVTDASGISYTLEAGDDNASNILWAISTGPGIVLGTNGGEWLLSASALNDPITPTSIQAHRVTKYRCSYVKPVQTPLSIVFVQRFQRKVMEFLQDVFTGRYVAPNLTAASKHLTTAGIEEVAYQEEITPIVWMRDLAGALRGITYRRQSSFPTEEPLFTGWHRHVHGEPGRIFASLCMSPDGSSTLLDFLYTVTSNDSTNGTYRIQRMVKQFDINDAFASGFFLDGGVVPVGMLDLGTGVEMWGLSAHAGQSVAVTLGGVYMGLFTPDSDGRLTVPYTSTVTAGYLQSLESVDLGDAGTTLVFSVSSTPSRSPTPFTIASYDGSLVAPSSGGVSNPAAAADYTDGYFATAAGSISSTNWNISTYNLTSFVQEAQVTGASLFSVPNQVNILCFSGGSLMLQMENDQTDVLQKLNPTTLVSEATMGTTTNFPSTFANNLILSGGACAFSYGSTPLLFSVGSFAGTNGGVTQVVNTSSMTTIGSTGPTLAGALGAPIPMVGGAVGAGIVYVMEFTSSTVATLKAMVVNSALSSFAAVTLGTIAPTAIDSTWTHLAFVSLGYDLADNNLVGLVSTTDSVTNTSYYVKVDSANGAILWATAVSTADNIPQLNQGRIDGMVSQMSSAGVLRAIQTSNGAIISTTTITSAGLPVVGNNYTFSDSITGAFYAICNYNSGTPGAPTQIGSTPSTFDEWAALFVGNELVGPSTTEEVYNVPAVVGFDYSSTTQAQMLRPGTAPEAGAANGPPQGKKRRANQFAALFQASQAVSIGTDFTHLFPIDFTTPGSTPYTVTQLFSGVWWDTLSDDFSYDSMIAWQSTGPYPLSVVSMSGFLETQDY